MIILTYNGAIFTGNPDRNLATRVLTVKEASIFPVHTMSTWSFLGLANTLRIENLAIDKKKLQQILLPFSLGMP